MEQIFCCAIYGIFVDGFTAYYSDFQTRRRVFIPSLLLLKFSDKATFDSLFPVSANMYHHTYSVSFLWFPPHKSIFFFIPSLRITPV